MIAQAILNADPPAPQAKVDKERELLKKFLSTGNFFGRFVSFQNGGRLRRGTILRADIHTARVEVEEEYLGAALYAWPSTIKFYNH